jgi:hypothetical protein
MATDVLRFEIDVSSPLGELAGAGKVVSGILGQAKEPGKVVLVEDCLELGGKL